jgi:hypothetical protein
MSRGPAGSIVSGANFWSRGNGSHRLGKMIRLCAEADRRGGTRCPQRVGKQCGSPARQILRLRRCSHRLSPRRICDRRSRSTSLRPSYSLNIRVIRAIELMGSARRHQEHNLPTKHTKHPKGFGDFGSGISFASIRVIRGQYHSFRNVNQFVIISVHLLAKTFGVRG